MVGNTRKLMVISIHPSAEPDRKPIPIGGDAGVLGVVREDSQRFHVDDTGSSQIGSRLPEFVLFVHIRTSTKR